MLCKERNPGLNKKKKNAEAKLILVFSGESREAGIV